MITYTVKYKRGLFGKYHAANASAALTELSRIAGFPTWQAYCRFHQMSEKIKVYGHTIIIDYVY